MTNTPVDEDLWAGVVQDADVVVGEVRLGREPQRGREPGVVGYSGEWISGLGETGADSVRLS